MISRYFLGSAEKCPAEIGQTGTIFGKEIENERENRHGYISNGLSKQIY